MIADWGAVGARRPRVTARCLAQLPQMSANSTFQNPDIVIVTPCVACVAGEAFEVQY